MKSDFWCGVESGFPLCCIDFFINFWCPVRFEHKMFHGRPECYDWGDGAGHVECSDCLIKRIKN